MTAKLEPEERIRMMQSLFGDQSAVDDEEESVNSEHELTANHLDFEPDEAELKVEIDSGSEVEVQGEAEAHSMDNEGETVQSSQVRTISAKRAVIRDEGYFDSEVDKQRMVTSRRTEVAPTESLGPDHNRHSKNDDEDDVGQARKASISPEGQKKCEVVRHIFGDSDEDVYADNGAQNELKPDSHACFKLAQMCDVYGKIICCLKAFSCPSCFSCESIGRASNVPCKSHYRTSMRTREVTGITREFEI